jgi:murein DD-endopeptidase MepM/ murein hydrolase activator NlpD
MSLSREQHRAFAEIRFVRDVQYATGAAVDAIVGPETHRLWMAWQVDRQLIAPCAPIASRKALIRNVQAALGVEPDGDPGRKTWGAWVRAAYPEAIAAGVKPIPRYAGADPAVTSGFNAGRGPNFARRKPYHYGCDWLYRWREHDHDGATPPHGWSEHHFGLRSAREFYGPPTPVYAVLPGEVTRAELLPVSAKWGGPRWCVQVDHGRWGDLGRVRSWSVHHERLLVDVGDVVDADTPVAILGDTGARGAPHTHHEMWRRRDDGAWNRRADPFNAYHLWASMRTVEVAA